jgi:prophage tail gpP-like protein
MKPVVITIGGSEVTQWTEMTLTRKKEDLTGELNVTLFGGSMPSMPILREILASSPIEVYVAGQLAFTGTVDKRKGEGHHGKHGKPMSPSRQSSHGVLHHGGGHNKGKTGGGGASHPGLNLGPNQYLIKITARGKTKRLIDSSHQHPTTNMLKPTTKEVVEKLVEPWKVPVEFLGEVIKLDKVRFRDGARVVDELNRVSTENCYFMYETRDGKLKVTDGVGSQSGSGDPLILGQNILTFEAEQSEDQGRSKVKVKGQRSPKDKWGEEAVLKTFKEVQDGWIKSFAPETVHHNGDGDEKTLERRARFEMNQRSTKCKKLTIEVFHVQTPSGQPWDIGDTHYVEIPVEGIYDTFEVTELTYTVDHEKTLMTKLVLSPPPSGGAGGASGGFGLSNIASNTGLARASQAGFSMQAGMFPAPWVGPQLSELPLMTLVEAAAQPQTPADQLAQQQTRPPPMELPSFFDTEDEVA